MPKLAALFRRRHIGDVGKSGGDAGSGNAGDEAPHEQPGEVGRQRHEDIIETQPETGNQHHRAPPIAVGNGAQQR